MSGRASKRHVPERRFPDFQGAQGWAETTLGKVASFEKGKGISKADVSPNGIQPCIRYGELYTHYSETIHTVFSHTNISPAELVLSQANDVIIPASGKTEIDIATASCVLKSGIALGSDLNIIRSKMNGVFLSYYLNNAKKQAIAQLAQGIAVVHLYASQLKTLTIDVPERSEQKKIADCLSSIDDLIAAQARKVAALKARKQGLMQQLFPGVGEAVPRVRFPECGAGGRWVEKRIGRLVREVVRPIEMSDVGNYSLVTVKRRYGGVESRGEFRGRSIKVKSQFLIKEDDFLISNRQIVHCACGVVPGGLKGSIVSNEYSVLEAMPECDIKFFWYFAQQPRVSESFLSSSRGIVIEKMLFDLGYWLNRKFQFPGLSEQKRIGHFLASIDNLIDRNVCKLESLRAQKSGLMKGLFPSAVKGGA